MSSSASQYCIRAPERNSMFMPLYIEIPRMNNPIDKLPINSMGIRLDGDYVKVDSDCGNGTGYISGNPLTYDAPRAIRSVFDRPNYTGKVNVSNTCSDEIYKPMYDAYGKQKYDKYSDINTGSIQYYVDRNDTTPYTSPNFTANSIVKSRFFIDPNGNTLPTYDRQNLQECSSNQNKDCVYPNCLSDTNDQLVFREDIMSRQMRKMNQENWSYRYGNEVSGKF